MTLDIHNWSSSVHQEIHKIVKDEIYPIVNQVDTRVQNFEIQFLKEAAKFVRDFKSLAKEADESLAKHKALEFEIEHLLKAVVSQDIMSIVQSNSVVDTSNLQTELDRTKEKLETCIIKKEKEYVVLWNNWYKKCEECKYDKILYDKAYNDMQQNIEWLQAQLGDLKGKSKDTPCVSDTLNPVSQKLEDENMSLEFQAQNKLITHSLQENLHDTIYENATLRAQLFDKVSEQKDTTKGTSANTKFANQSILGKPPSSSKSKLYSITPFPNSKVILKVGETNALLKPVTSNSVARINIEIMGVSSEGNNIKLAIRNEKYEVFCATCKQCLITANHDECVFNYVNGINSSKKNQSANVSESANQKKLKSNVKKSKKLGSKERLASPRPSKPKTCLRWLPTRRISYLCGKITAFNNIESDSNTFICDNASASNPQEPTSKGFVNYTFLDKFTRLRRQNSCIHPLDIL
ncbi:hypothetical protein Tco_1309990 [Tanacetum coccineum]